MKRQLYVIFLFVLLMFSGVTVFAGEAEDAEWFEMTEGEGDSVIQPEIANPYNLYLGSVYTAISYPGDYDIKLRAEVYCSDTVATIQTNFYLQKKYNGVWTTVSQGTATKTDSHYMYKNMYVYNVTAGTYRCMTNTKVTSYSGYAETMDSYSPSVTIS